VEVVTHMLLMGLVRLNVTAMLVMVHMRSHMLRVVLRLMVLRVMTVVTVMFFVMLRHLNSP
jgi:hypothetical protein